MYPVEIAFRLRYRYIQAMGTSPPLLFRIIRYIAIIPILIYQKIISPALPGSCIYSPTCSAYSKEAVLKHGVLKGTALGLGRIFRCAGGLYTGGEDPVPEKFSFSYLFGSYKRFWRRRKKGNKSI